MKKITTFLAALLLLALHAWGQCNFPVNGNTVYPFGNSGCRDTPNGIKVGAGNGNNDKMIPGETVTFNDVITSGGELTTVCTGGHMLFMKNVTLSKLTTSCNLTIEVATGATLTINGQLTTDNDATIIVRNGGKLVVTGVFTSKNDTDIIVDGGGAIDFAAINAGNRLNFEIANNATVKASSLASGTNAEIIINGLLDVSGTITMGNDAVMNGSGTVKANSIIAGQNNQQASCELSNQRDCDLVFILPSPTSCSPSGTDLCLEILKFLPVTLVSFTAEAERASGSVMLKWATSVEENNSHFEVERSGDGRSFAKIATVLGKGTFEGLTNYQLRDLSPLNGTNYYRLKQVDTDGTTAYSKVVAANLGASLSPDQVGIFFNPVSATLEIQAQLGEQGRAWVSVADYTGKEVKRTLLEGNQLIHLVSLPNALPAGLYVVRVQLPSAQESKKILIP